MARLRTYELDTTISDNDYLLGNDVDSESSIATKRFALSELRTYFIADTVTDILNTVPGRHVPTVNQAGDGVERSPIEITHAVTSSDILLTVDGDVDGATVRYAIDQNGIATLRFENFNQPYYLEGFVGNDISFTTTLSGNLITHTGTIVSYDGYEQDDNDIYDTFTITTDPVLTEATNLLLSLTITGGTEVAVNMAGLTLTGDLLVEGMSQFNQDITLGTSEDGDEDVDILLHGSLIVEGAQGGIVLGEGDDNVTFTTNGSDLVIGGGGDLTIDNEVEFRNTEGITVTTGPINVNTGPVNINNGGDLILTDDDGNMLTISTDGIVTTPGSGQPTLDPIVAVVGNPGAPRTQDTHNGLLGDIRIGEDYYSIPSLTSSVASALPGLNETLAGPETAITIGRFFVGIEQGTSSLFQASSTLAPGVPRQVEIGITNNQLGGDGGGNSAFITQLRTELDALDAGNSIFFVSTDYTDAFPTDMTTLIPETITGGLYELLAFNDKDGAENIIVFSRLGGGTLNLGTEVLNITSETVLLPNLEDGAAADFVYYDPTTDRLSHESLVVQGRANGARSSQGTMTDIALTSIEFTPQHNISGTVAAPVIDISGRLLDAGERTGDFVGVSFSTYILGTIPANPDLVDFSRTMTLPTGAIGDIIKIANLSNLDVTGSTVTIIDTGTWRLLPTAGQSILGLPNGTNLILDNIIAGIELVFTASRGWIIIGSI